MINRFAEARKRKGLKAVQVAELVGVTKGTLSTWESGQKMPTYDNLLTLANLYGCSIDYLLCRTPVSTELPDGAVKLDLNVLNIYHGRPVWSSQFGWLLVNGSEKYLIAEDGKKYQYEEVGVLYTVPVNYSISSISNSSPLNLHQLVSEKTVWVEPISPDRALAEQLRGVYHLKESFVENEYGQKFYLDNLGKDWIAFKK